MTEARKVGSELVGAARDSAMSLLDAQRSRAADQIAAIGDAVRRSAESLDETGGGALVRYADQTANQIRGFADTIRDRSWTELADDIEGFARRWPMVYMASAVGIGFIAGRFMLSSAERPGAAHRSSPAATTGHSPGGTTGPAIRGGNPAIPSGTSGGTRIGPGTPAGRE